VGVSVVAALIIHSSPPLKPRKGQVMDENIMLNEAGITISQQFLHVHGKSYAMADIQQVESRLVEPKRIVALILLFCGMALLLNEGSLFALGGFCVLLGIVLWVAGGTKYSLVLHTAAGEHRVLTSHDRLFIEKVIHALATARQPAAQPRVHMPAAAQAAYSDISFGAS
jgi:hypothetical protein